MHALPLLSKTCDKKPSVNHMNSFSKPSMKNVPASITNNLTSHVTVIEVFSLEDSY